MLVCSYGVPDVFAILGQGVFNPLECAAGIAISDDHTVATKTWVASFDTNVMLTRPAPDSKGRLTLTWRHVKGENTYFGWAVPGLNPNTDAAIKSHGSFVWARTGSLYGLGTKALMKLPSGGIPVGATLSLRYDPTLGTMHARTIDGAEILCFTDMRSDLVPAVCLWDKGDSCATVNDVSSQEGVVSSASTKDGETVRKKIKQELLREKAAHTRAKQEQAAAVAVARRFVDEEALKKSETETVREKAEEEADENKVVVICNTCYC
jgi:hypothetical protein